MLSIACKFYVRLNHIGCDVVRLADCYRLSAKMFSQQIAMYINI